MEKREEAPLPAVAAADLPGENSSIEGWVSCLATADIIFHAHDQNASLEDLLSGVGVSEETLTDMQARISWETFLQLWRNASTIWSDDEIVGLGRKAIALDSFRTFVELALSLSNPIDCLRVHVTALSMDVTSCAEMKFKQVGRDRVEIEIRLSEGYQPCPQWFLLSTGFFEVLPTIYGYPTAAVDMIATDRGAVWKIWIRPPADSRATLRDHLRRLGGLFVSRVRRSEAKEKQLTSYDVLRRRVLELDAKLVGLKKREERFVQIFRSAPTAMLISRVNDMSVFDVNDTLLSMTGFSREVVMGWGRKELSVWASVEDRDAVYTTVQDEGDSIDGREIRLRHRDGHEIVGLLSAKPVDLGGEPCILWQAIDVTARKQAELELAEHRDRLKELVEERTRELERSLKSMQDVERLASIGTLAAGIAHQINNPIASIRAASEFALMSDDQPDAIEIYREALESCVDQSDRCGLIVRNILLFSRGESGPRCHTDLRQLVVRSCQLVAKYAAENGATIELDEGESELPVLINAIEMEQVLVNVLRNAIEAGAGDGNGKTRVEVLMRRLDTGAFVEIRDDGSGIDTADLTHLFDPFYTTRLERGGTGLGLSVAHGIVNAHGGAIRADTAVDHGTAIQIQLPLAVEEPPKPHLVPVS